VAQPRLNSMQMMIFFVSATIGSGILTLPREMAEFAKQDAWISVALAVCVFGVSSWFALDTARLYPNETFDSYIQKIFGRHLGQLILLWMITQYIFVASLEGRRFAVIMKLFMLDQTPAEVIVIILLITSYIICRYGLQPIVYFQEIMFVPTTLGFITLILLAYSAVDLHEVRPILAHKPGIVAAIPSGGLALTGMEVLAGFFFSYLYEPAKKKALSSMIAGFGLIFFIYTLVMIVTIGVFSAEELHYLIYPTPMLLRTVELGGGIVERLDALFLIVYIPIVVTALLCWHYMTAFALANMWGLEEERPMVLLLVPLLYVVSLFLPDLPSSFKFGNFVSRVVFWFAVIGVPGIWVVAHLRRRVTE
jgi:spore germination protein